MSYPQRQKIVAALNAFIELGKSLPRYISEEDCLLNQKK
jgi:hypothetical protein